MVQIAAAVEDNGLDACGDGALGHDTTHRGSGRGVGGGALELTLQLALDARRSHESVAARVVDHLRGDVVQAAVHGETGTGFDTLDPLADAAVALVARGTAIVLGEHVYLPFPALPDLPALRRRFSPRYSTPLPLYGSGLRKLRILAATCPTTSLSAPLTLICVGVGTSMLMPSGGE